MNGSRQVLALLSRCRYAFHPTLPSATSYHLTRTSVKIQICPFSTGRNVNTNNKEDFPKLPIEKPWLFGMGLMRRTLKQLDWLSGHTQDVNRANTVNESANKILSFITESLVEENFEVLENKFTPEALNEARSIVAGLPGEKKQDLVFKTSPPSSLFSFFSAPAPACVFHPWAYTADGNCLDLTYIGLCVCSSQQRAWLMTLAIPIEDTTLSEDYKVTRFSFETCSTTES